MAIHELKEQIARLPEQPGVYLYFNGDGDTIYVGKARALRDRVRNYLGAYGSDAKTDALLDEVVRLEVIVTDSVVEALALENNLIKQRTPEIQHPAARRQELSVPAADDQRAVPARAGRAPRRARRQLLRRPVHAGAFRAQDDVADAPAVRDALVQRSDHRQARAAVPRIRHQALHRAVRRHDLLAPRTTRAPSTSPSCSSKGKNDELREDAEGADARRGRRRAVRGGGAGARCDAHRADAARSPAEDGDRGARAPRRLRPQARSGRRRDSGLPGAQRPRRRAHRARHRRGRRRHERGGSARGGDPAVLRAARRAAGDPRAGRAQRARSARELAVGTRRPACAHRRAAARREARLRRSRQPQRGARLPDAVQPGEDRAVRRARNAAARARLCRRCRGGSSASTSRRSRAARPWRRWWCAKTAG